MGQATFYAARADEADVLRFVLEETDCQVYEAYSRYDCELRRFATVAEACDALEVGDDRPSETRSVLLDLWSPSTGGQLAVQRREVRIEGATFRYETSGWGLYRVHLGGCSEGTVHRSWVSHNTEKRAQRWSDTYTELAGPETWDWEAVNRIGRQITHHIKNRLAVSKVDSASVLPEADELQRAGWSLA